MGHPAGRAGHVYPRGRGRPGHPPADPWFKRKEWLVFDIGWREIYFNRLPWKGILRALLLFSPAIAFALWKVSYFGLAFSSVEQQWFGRGFFSLGSTFYNWSEAFRSLSGTNPNASANYSVEFFAIILGFTACIAGLRRHPDLAWFGLLVVLLSFTSGPAQGMHRYVLAAPPVFLFLSRLGEKPAFDRVWTTASVLVMGMMATMFMFDMWAG